MSELKSDFTRDDLETLIEAMGDWEALGNEEWNVMQMIKNSPMPPEDHEAFEYFRQIKDHFAKREQVINDNRISRQERAVFLKAKLMMVRKDMAFDQLFNMVDIPLPVKKQMPPSAVVPGSMAVAVAPVAVASDSSLTQEDIEKLTLCKKKFGSLPSNFDLSEYFICDLGVWDHYQRYLKEKSEK